MSNSVFFYEPFYDIDRFFNDANGRTPGQLQQRQGGNGGSVDGAIRPFKPRMDLHEDSEKNLVTATFELPGLKKEDVQIDLSNGQLKVSAESQISSENDEGGYAIRERRYGRFARTLQLPKGVKDDEIKASMENGVLTITFPKSAPEAAPKKITIS